MEKNSVLIIDDSITGIAALSQILHTEYTIYTETNGRDGIKAARELAPDVILLDILMPDLDGFEVLEILQSDSHTKDIPVIFITGLNNVEAEERGLALGASDYINKPFSAGIVGLRIRSQMKILNQMRLIHSISITDPLTGIGNRRHFNSTLETEWRRAMRDNAEISFLIMDIDNFKKFNDKYGHLAGDMVLKMVAERLKSQLKRTTDALARWGGEEFAAILPATGLEGARIVAESLRSSIERAAFVLDNNMPASVTISIGIHSAIPREGGLTAEKLVAAADSALYHAKQNGRNRIIAAADLE